MLKINATSYLFTLEKLVQLFYFLFFAFCISIRNGYSYAAGLLLLVALPFLFYKKNSPRFDKHAKRLIAVFLCYVLIQGISILWDNGIIKDFDRPSKVLMASAVLVLMLRYPPHFLWLMNGIATGAITAGIRALWDRQIVGFGRAFDWMMPIQGGDISMSLGLLSLCGVMWSIKNARYRHLLCYSVATAMGIAGSVLSQSRGGWVLFPVIVIVIYRIFRPWMSSRIKGGMAIAAGLLVVICLLPQTGVTHRFMEARQDVSQYFSGGSKNTSLGLRFEFWKSALHSFAEKPIFGWGTHGVLLSQEKQYHNGLITKEAAENKTHAHNQFLDEMAKRGVIGLTALLALFMVPLSAFNHYLKTSENAESRTLAAGGVVFVLSIVDYCLSQAFLSHNSGIVFYCFGVCAFFAALTSYRKTTPQIETDKT